MSTLHVFWDTTLVGRLTMTSAREVVFQYDEDFMGSPLVRPISWSLPLDGEPHSGPRAAAWFANLLPEGEVRGHVARELGISERNDFALLEAIGGDCAGALQLVPDREPPGADPKLIPLPWDHLEKKIAARPRPSLLALMAEEGNLRLSLAGAQDKLPVHYTEGDLSLPAGGAASTHLLKVSSRSFVDLVPNEFFCLSLAREVGLPVARAFLGPTLTPTLLVERYDRAREETGRVIRLHQEDFCQALGHGPDTKYEAEGGPSLAELFAVLNAASRTPLPDKRDLLRLILFNYLIGNADAHAKNISLLYGRLSDTAGPRLAPFYDLVCTRIYDGLTTKNAQKIGDEYRSDRMHRRHWGRLAEALDVNPRYLFGLGVELCDQVTPKAETMAGEMASTHGGGVTLEKIVAVIGRRVERMRGDFG